MDKFLLRPQKNEKENHSKQDKHQNKKSTSSKCKYNENHIQYGFILFGKDNSVHFYMISLTTLTKETMVQLTSYKIAHLLAKKEKPHSDAENIILPVLDITIGTIISDKAIKQIKTIPLSAHTIRKK
eukprot:XP_014786996.1 PREDICTED: protein FAM200A-like [Octopus bimaculoides]